MSSNPFHVRVQPTLDPPGLRLRAQATTASDTLAFEAPGTVLSVLETEASARPKIGVSVHWIRVRDVSSRKGYVAAGGTVRERERSCPLHHTSGMLRNPRCCRPCWIGLSKGNYDFHFFARRCSSVEAIPWFKRSLLRKVRSQRHASSAAGVPQRDDIAGSTTGILE